jgi:hypothetical protein
MAYTWDRERMHKITEHYEIGTTDQGDFIRCLHCGLKSFHPDDVKNRYCGKCHVFHEEPRSWPAGH